MLLNKLTIIIILFTFLFSCKNTPIKSKEEDGLIHKAEILFKTNQKESFKLFNELIVKYPDNEKVNYYLGCFYAQSLNYDLAFKYLHKTIEINPKKWEAYKEIGKIYKSLNKYEEALKYIEKIFIFTSEADAESNFFMGFLLNKVKKNENSENIEKYYLNAIRLEPKYIMVYIHLGSFYFSLKQFEKAKEIWEKGLTFDENNLTLLERSASLQISLKNYKKAIENYEKLIKYHPNYVESYFNIGKCYEYLNDFEDALKSYNEAIKINPNYQFAKQAIGEIYLTQKNYKEALNIFTDLFKTTSEPFYLYKQGLIHKILNDANNLKITIQSLSDLKEERAKEYLNLLKK